LQPWGCSCVGQEIEEKVDGLKEIKEAREEREKV
jgi:hypothetical protein